MNIVSDMNINSDMKVSSECHQYRVVDSGAVLYMALPYTALQYRCVGGSMWLVAICSNRKCCLGNAIKIHVCFPAQCMYACAAVNATSTVCVPYTGYKYSDTHITHMNTHYTHVYRNQPCQQQKLKHVHQMIKCTWSRSLAWGGGGGEGIDGVMDWRIQGHVSVGYYY